MKDNNALTFKTNPISNMNKAQYTKETNPYGFKPKVLTAKLKTIVINKPIYKTQLSIRQTKPFKLIKRNCYKITHLNINHQSLSPNTRVRTLTPLFKRINSTDMNKELNQLSSCDFIKKSNPHQITRHMKHESNEFKPDFLKQEITLVPLKKVTFRFENPVQKAKINHYLVNFSKITLITNHSHNYNSIPITN